MSRLDIINSILEGNRTRFRIGYFEKNYPVILKEILDFCNNISDIPFNQKVWHWVNNFPNRYFCKCGNSTSFNRNWLDGYKKSCSAKCVQSEQSTKDKRKSTTLKKWGVDNIAKSDIIKKRQESTNLEKWGFKSSFQNSDVRKKWVDGIKEKWGVDHYFKTNDFKIKSKVTNLEKWGVEHFVQSDEYINKSKITNNSKWGTDWYTQTDDWIRKTIITNNSKWGTDWYTQTDRYKEHMSLIMDKVLEKEVETNLERWGVRWYSQSDEYKDRINEYWDKIRGTDVYSNILEKTRNTNLEKWGVEWFTQTDEYRNFLKSDDFRNSIRETTIKLSKIHYEKIGYEFISSDGGYIKLIGKCGHEFQSSIYNFSRRYKSQVPTCTVCNPLNSGQSGQELNLIEWLRSLGVVVEIGRRDIISPREIDIFIPSSRLAIEYNGLYWHGEIYKDKNYHLNKMISCEEKEIDLIQVWEDDWIERRDIIKSIIRNRLGLITNKIWARDCKIKEVNDRKLVNKFFDGNHIQGKTRYKTSIGLYYNDELISCMLFNTPRLELELVRFANKIDYSVSGSASRLFKFYLNKYNPSSIISFADRSIFKGDLYKSLEFEFKWKTEPNYWWVVDNKREHRFRFRKDKLIKDGFDSNMTEVEIMHSRGYWRVWGVGLDKWVYKNNPL